MECQAQCRDKEMTQKEMYQVSFQRPTNYLKLTPKEQWDIDKELGILDWTGEGMDEADTEIYLAHYDKEE